MIKTREKISREIKSAVTNNQDELDMNKPNFNFNQISRKCCNRSKDLSNFTRSPPVFSPYYHHSFSRVGDSGICDGMNNCHLTESWASYMHHQPINDIPILNPYVPLRMPIELQTTSNGVLRGTFYHQQNALLNQEYLRNVYSVNQFKNVELKDRAHPQHQLMQDGFSRLAELNYEPPLRHDEPSVEAPNNCATNMNEHEERVKTSIKFQDRNKKLDFKVNFRDENRKLNGCFHRDDSKSPNVSVANSSSAAPPKKKWIRHYLTGKVKF